MCILRSSMLNFDPCSVYPDSRHPRTRVPYKRRSPNPHAHKPVYVYDIMPRPSSSLAAKTKASSLSTSDMIALCPIPGLRNVNLSRRPRCALAP